VTAPSPLPVDAAVITFSIEVDGKAIDSAVQVDCVDTWISVNKLPRARLVIFDGSAAESNFPLSDLDTFIPGKKVRISAGYDSKNETIFEGVVVRQGLSVDQTEAPKLIVDLTDEAIKMTLERKNALFEKITDGDLIGKLISANGLSKDVASTKTVHEEIVQYYVTDWDLMMMRAEMNGLVVIADSGKVTVKPPDTSQSPVLAVKFGESILDLDIELDAASQFASSAIKSYTWDPDTQKLIESGPGTVSVKEAGNLSSADLAKVFGVSSFTQQTGGAIEQTALQDWSSGELLKSMLSKIRGTVRFQGSSLARVGKTIELAGVGDRFNGPLFISGVHQRIHNGEWLTTAELGLCAHWFAAEAPHVTAPGASGQLPAVAGLQTGIVKNMATDPGGEFRVQVSLPLLQDDAKKVWARLGTFYASNKFGAFFYPEVDDEVVVGFMNDDPRYPVILGSVYGKKLAPPLTPDAENTKKALVTRGNLEITFDDKDKVIEVKTPGGQSIVMSDKAGSIVIKDKNGNTVSMAGGGITLDSGTSVKITAKGDITLDAGANLNLTAKANATMEGLQITHNARTKLTAKGTVSSEVSSSGILTIRGSLVNIN
jgi:Rhs element Vgr protein